MNHFMKIAYSESLKAFRSGNCPVGAVIVRDNKVISKAYNRKNSMNISIYHAEILAIIKACKKLKRWILDDCELYVTLEPCMMCKNAIAETRIRKVYYLVNSEYTDNLKSNVNKISFNKIDCCNEYSDLLSSFFEMIR